MDVGHDAEAAIHELFVAPAQDPFPLYDALREMGDGVHQFSALGAWAVFRYEDVLQLTRDPELYSSQIFAISPPGWHNPEDPEQRRFVDISGRALMFQDPPVHTQLRGIVREAFTPRAVGRWEPLIHTAVDELLGRFDQGQELDLVRELAGEVPVAVITSILGVPVDDRWQFREWSFALASTYDPAVQGADRDRCIGLALELIDYLAEIAADRRRHPRDDLTTIIVNAKPEGEDAISDADLLSQLTLLLVAGNDTTANLIANGIAILINHPEIKRQLARQPELTGSAIEEVLRYDPPLHLAGRLATRESVVGETTIPAGSILMQVLAAANRDPRAFDAPGTFDVGRASNRHLSFNHGIHFCVGAPLARLEGGILIQELLRRFPDIGPGDAPAVRRTSNLAARGWQTLPVIL